MMSRRNSKALKKRKIRHVEMSDNEEDSETDGKTGRRAGVVMASSFTAEMEEAAVEASRRGGFRRGDCVFMWRQVRDGAWVKRFGHIGAVVDSEVYTVAFDAVGDVKGEEMEAHASAIFQHTAEIEPPRPRDHEATKDAKVEEETAVKAEAEAAGTAEVETAVKVETDAADAAGAEAEMVETAEAEAPPLPLDKGTRVTVLWEDEEPPTWFDGCVAGFSSTKGHHIRYDDGDRRW